MSVSIDAGMCKYGWEMNQPNYQVSLTWCMLTLIIPPHFPAISSHFVCNIDPPYLHLPNQYHT